MNTRTRASSSVLYIRLSVSHAALAWVFRMYYMLFTTNHTKALLYDQSSAIDARIKASSDQRKAQFGDIKVPSMLVLVWEKILLYYLLFLFIYSIESMSIIEL